MNATAPEQIPYGLPMPISTTPVVLPALISADNPHANSRYDDPVWALAPLIDNPGTTLRALHWRGCPEALRGQVKLTTWTMINGELRPTQLKDRGVRSTPRSSAGEMRLTCQEWMRLARWLHQRGVSDLRACTEDCWRAYAAERLTDGIRRDYAEKILGRLTDLWAFDQLSPAPCGIAVPPWHREGADDYLPRAGDTSAAENLTEPLDPLVIGPLLAWALRLVDDLADDILAAWAEKRRLCAALDTASADGQAALHTRLLALLEGGGALPSYRRKGRLCLGRHYIAAATGASLDQVNRFATRHQLAELPGDREGPCPLGTPATGRINDRPWREHIDFYEVSGLMRHLATAAMIVCLYLTGMRPQEVQSLRAGCCPDPEPDPGGTPGRHLIRSRHFKNITDHEGRHVSAGAQRAVPWVAIAPVVRAIRVLERMVPDGELLFNAACHDYSNNRGLGGALKARSLTNRVKDFVAWANREAHEHGLPGQIIPDDPHGPISLTRFRRSLAWHIARRPRGLIALAIQYGHMRTVLDARASTGYASRSRRGLHSVLDIETALAAADTAAHLRERIAAGERLSGPAARRALTAAGAAPRFEGRLVPATFAKKAAAYLARDGMVLFDNPETHLICVFKRDIALCDPDPGATAPNQHDCRRGCGNAARLDSHAHRLREHADTITQLAAHAPGPIRDRLTAAAARHHADATAHENTAQPPAQDSP